MFTISQNPTFTQTVSVMVPANTGHREETMKARFRVIAEAEAQNFDFSTSEGTTQFLRAAVSDIEDLRDEEGERVPFDARTAEVLFGLPYVRVALVRAYFAAVTKVRAGN